MPQSFVSLPPLGGRGSSAYEYLFSCHPDLTEDHHNVTLAKQAIKTKQNLTTYNYFSAWIKIFLWNVQPEQTTEISEKLRLILYCNYYPKHII